MQSLEWVVHEPLQGMRVIGLKVLLFYMHVDIIYKMGNDFHDIVCLSILLINLIKLLAKTIAYKRSLNSKYLKNRMSDLAEIWELSLV